MRRAATSVPDEIEAKLLVPSDAVLHAIARLDRLGAHRLQARGTARLHSVYLDTRDMTLARHGVALRLRRHGRRWEATAKWSGRVRGTGSPAACCRDVLRGRDRSAAGDATGYPEVSGPSAGTLRPHSVARLQVLPRPGAALRPNCLALIDIADRMLSRTQGRQTHDVNLSAVAVSAAVGVYSGRAAVRADL
jgi:hypothetical protein